MPRVFVLAVDCLDYRMLDWFGLEELKQKRWGTINVEYLALPGPHKEKLLTPTIWGTFIAGRRVQLGWYVWRSRLHMLAGRVVQRLAPKWFEERKGMFQRLVNNKDLGCETLFEKLKPSIALYVPAYNDPAWYHLEYDRAVREEGVRALEEVVRRVHEMKVNEAIRVLRSRRDWRFFMVWLDLVDMYQHMYYPHRIKKVRWAYHRILRDYERIRRLLPRDTVLLIASDHSIREDGLHGPWAFWSLNVEPPFEPQSMEDLHRLVVELARAG